MAVKVTFSSNLDEVIDLFQSAKSKCLLDIGATVRTDASSNSPARTGALRESWKATVDEDDSSVTVGVPLDALDGNYAKYQELGTSRGVKPHHMLRNAVEDNKDNFKQIVETTFKNA